MRNVTVHARGNQYTLPCLRYHSVSKGDCLAEEFNPRQSTQGEKGVKKTCSTLIEAKLIQFSFSGEQFTCGVEIPAHSDLWPKLPNEWERG